MNSTKSWQILYYEINCLIFCRLWRRTSTIHYYWRTVHWKQVVLTIDFQEPNLQIFVLLFPCFTKVNDTFRSLNGLLPLVFMVPALSCHLSTSPYSAHAQRSTALSLFIFWMQKRWQVSSTIYSCRASHPFEIRLFINWWISIQVEIVSNTSLIYICAYNHWVTANKTYYN